MVICGSPSCEQCGLICDRGDLPHPRELTCKACQGRAWDEIDRQLDYADDD